MKTSMTLPLKISRTKKRLSESNWYLPAALTGALGMLGAMIFALRATYISANYGIVPLEIPVISMPPNDNGLHEFKETPSQVVSDRTLTVILTSSAFYFGKVSAFTKDFPSAADKYVINHVGGAPDINNLVSLVHSQQRQIIKEHSTYDLKTIFFIPSQEIPMPIVIQTAAGLRKGFRESRLVMGGGIL